MRTSTPAARPREENSRFPSQRIDRIKVHRSQNCRCAPGKGNNHSNCQNERQQHRLNRNVRTKNGVADFDGPRLRHQQNRQLQRSEPTELLPGKITPQSSSCLRLKPSSNPTSARRSKIAVAMADDTASAEATSAASVINNINPLIRESTVPSLCATCRIMSACEFGIASCN